MRGLVSLVTVLVGMLALVPSSPAVAAAELEAGERVVVVLKDGVDARAAARDAARSHRAAVSFIYDSALRGFAARVPAGRLIGLRNDPRVDYVEPDRVHTIQQQATPTGVRRIFADTNDKLDIDGTDDFRVNVDVAVLDTGIDFGHPDLNVVGGVSCLGSWRRASCESGGDDDHYHGTHVAGTVGALDNGIGVVGVAAGARLHAVKVLDSQGRGWTSEIVAGVDWVAANAATIEVANMSLSGGGFNQAEYDAIQGAVDSGVAFAVAAGNSGADASNYSPAAFDNVLTVSALADFDGADGAAGTSTCRADEDDTLANFSNWGPAVQIAAPGVCIRSTYPSGGYATISGTSMASPHAAGALALLASRNNPSDAGDVDGLYDQVTSAGNFDWSDDSGDAITEPLLDVSDVGVFDPVLVAGSDGGDPGNSPPTAAFTHTCTDLSCDFDGSGSSDSDGGIVDYDWDFGDQVGDIGATTSHTYASSGEYTVTLTVTDDRGAAGSVSQTVTVTGPAPDPAVISLDAVGYKVKGKHHVDLTWSGTTAITVDVERDGKPIVTTANDGAYTDATGNRGGATYTYRVCEAVTSTCSNTVTVVF